MGSPLGPIFANIFLCHLESKIFNDSLDFMPMFFKRYVDDTLAFFNDLDHGNRFLTHINSIHPNIKFTIELEKDNSLPFLDINITRGDSLFTTKLYLVT